MPSVTNAMWATVSSITGGEGAASRRRDSIVRIGGFVGSGVWLVAVAFGMSASSAIAAGREEVVDLPTRPGQTVRLLVAAPTPPAKRPFTWVAPKTPFLGTIVLLVGGHGNLDIDPGGKIGWGRQNQLVRSRGGYVQAGYVTVLPDIATDLKDGSGAKPGYRWSRAHAEDLGKVVAYARKLAPPVILVATSRGAISAANATVFNSKLQPGRPDALVMTSGMLMQITPSQPAANTQVGQESGITQPVLLVAHALDGCPYTPPSSASTWRALLTNARRKDVRVLQGGDAGDPAADPCEALSHHGFLGQDAEVVKTITGWIGTLSRSPFALPTKPLLSNP
jgi:hypothetical protein